VLTSNGAGSAPSMQSPAAAGADTSLSNLSSTGENKVCQAWVNFNGSGTVAIRDSHNVSSITDNGTGRFRVNLTTSMPNANYSVALGSEGVPDRMMIALGNGNYPANVTTSAFGILTKSASSSTQYDPTIVAAQVFGD
jgi:hypothetical protein